MKQDETISKAIELLKSFDGISAVGLSGSAARGNPDEMSDLDIVAFASERIPDPESRKRRYAMFGISGTHFDIDLEISRSDGLKIDNMICDVLWMTLPSIKAFLRSLTKDFDCDEFLPGGLRTMQPLFDPHDEMISTLKNMIPPYSKERAKHRIRKNLNQAHVSIYVLKWMPKAVVRNDCFSFLKYEYEVLDNFFTTLFALNRQWYSNEKRLAAIARTLDITPNDVGDRIEAIILRRRECSTLSGSLQEIKRLFSDLAEVCRNIHPDLCIPTNWE